jgi:hypothetical protein
MSGTIGNSCKIPKGIEAVINQRIRLNENIIIPIINNNIQTKIEEKIKESFSLKESSKQLLELAKKAVEIAIEDGENEAMEYIGRFVKLYK